MDKQKHEMGDPAILKKKRVGKIDLFHQPLWQTHMTHNLLKQKLSQGVIIGKRKLRKFLLKSVSACICWTFLFEHTVRCLLKLNTSEEGMMLLLVSLFGWHLKRDNR